MRRRVRIALAALLIPIVASCDRTPLDPPGFGDVESIVVEDAPSPFARIVTVTLARAAPARLTWGLDGANPLTLLADSLSTVHRFVITRLRVSREYTIEALIPGDDAMPMQATVTTATMLPALASVTLADSGTPSQPLALVDVAGASGFGGLLVVEDGEIVGHYPVEGSLFGSTRRANGDFVLLHSALGLQVFDVDGTLVDNLPQATAATPYLRIHHDVAATPQNTILFIADDTATITDTLVTGEALWEWDPATDLVVKRFSAFDHLDWKTFRGVRSVPGNWLHGNGINFGPRGNVVMSFRNADYVISIAPDWSGVEWTMGGAAGTIALDPTERFYGQHFVSEPSAGRILLFDNGVERDPKYTRVVEFAVDAGAGTATKVWEYRHDPEIYAALVGSARRLANGNTLALFGMLNGHMGSTGPITAVEVTPAGALAWRLAFAGNITRIYRVNYATSLNGEVPGAFAAP